MKCSMKRVSILLSGVGAGLYPILSCALGLGDLQVDSRLNQPLRAHIEISDVSEEEWRQIHARLAQQGEDTLLRTTLDSIVFRATEDASHRHFVELRSNDPITEPLFDLSVEVAGQTVQVIRNYSVFLDPPGRDEVGSSGVTVAGNGTQAVMSPSVATVASTGEAPTQSAGAGGANARSAAHTAARRSTAGGAATRGDAGAGSRAAASRGAANAGEGTTARGSVSAGVNQQVGLQAGAVYTVVQSDTLERIVRRLGARTVAAKNQQMQWVFEHNPAAFYGSIDRLRAGAQLTLPEQGAAAPVAANRADAANAPAVVKGPEAQPTPVAAGGQKVTAADDQVLQAQLAGQVSTLQQSLAKMQATIEAQDAQIADLNRKIAARLEQQRAERATSALAARIAPEVASASDDAAQRPGAATSGDDTSVVKRAPRWSARRATYYWGGALGGAAILVAVLATVSRRRREVEEQYTPRYPLVEDSPFRYRATLESPPAPPPAKQPVRQPEPAMRKSNGGVQVEESPLPRHQSGEDESGLESWSTQTALLLSELPAADDTQPFMMAPHDDVEPEIANKRPSYTSNAEEPTAKLQAMETHTVELQTTGELMSPEELAEAELLGMDALDGPGHGRQADSLVAGGANRAANAAARDTEAENARTQEIGSRDLLAAETLTTVTNPGVMRTEEMDLALEQLREAQMSTTEIKAAELRRDRAAASKEVAEILEASLNYEPDRVDIKLKLLEIYHHEALGNRDNFRSLLGKLAKDSRLLSPAQREHVEALQRTLNDGKQDADSSFVAEVAI